MDILSSPTSFSASFSLVLCAAVRLSLNASFVVGASRRVVVLGCGVGARGAKWDDAKVTAPFSTMFTSISVSLCCTDMALSVGGRQSVVLALEGTVRWCGSSPRGYGWREVGKLFPYTVVSDH